MKSFIALFIVLAIAAVYGAEESKVTEKRGIYGGLGYGYSGYPGLGGHGAGYYGGIGGLGYGHGLGYGSQLGYYGSYPGYYGSHSGYLGGYSGYSGYPGYGLGYGLH